MTQSNIIKLIISITLPLSIGTIAGFFTSQEITTWYATLNKPSFSPPNWLFGPVWTTLYILMGISFYLIWKQPPGKTRNNSLVIYIIHLALNFTWTFLFFYFHRIDLALIEIILLLMSIIIFMRLFYIQKPAAAYLNIPYLLWVTFASTLNAAYYSLN